MLLGLPYQQTDVVSHLKDTSLICSYLVAAQDKVLV